MNGLDENKFDQMLRSKLEGSSMEPPRDLMPGIMEAVDANVAAGGSRQWSGGFVIGLLALSILGYYVYSSFESNQIADTEETIITSDGLEMNDENKSIALNEVSGKIEGMAKNGSNQDDNSSNETMIASKSNNISDKNQNGETIGNNGSELNESARAEVKSNIVNEAGAIGQQIIDRNSKQVQGTEKSVVAKVLAKKIDNSAKQDNSSAIREVEKVTSNASSKESSTVVQVAANDNEPENIVVDTKIEQKIVENDINSPSLSNEINQAVILGDLENTLISSSSIESTNESIKAIESEGSMSYNSTIDSTSESVKSSDIRNTDSPELSGVNDNVDQNDLSGENGNTGHDNSESISIIIDDTAENEQILLNNPQKDEIDQSKNDFVDSLQTAIQSQIGESNQVNDASVLELKETKWGIDIHAGPSMCFRTLNVEGNEDLQNHKNDSESMLMTYSYSGEITRVIGSKWKVHIGAMYLRTGEKYSFSNGHNTHEATNKYDYVAIPIGVDYTLLKAGKFEFLTGVGAQYNFLQKGVSSWLDPHNFSAQTHSNDNSSSPFREHVLAWNAEFGLRYRLTNRVDAILKEEGILFNNSIYKTETGMDQREYSFETFIGLGYRF
ncbi:MAG: hypothetical protein ACI8XB_000664 [Patiriisocius sp.]|jgi:hypothetical protein